MRRSGARRSSGAPMHRLPLDLAPPREIGERLRQAAPPAPPAGATRSSRLACALTSSIEMRPSGPLPATRSISTPSSRAMRRTDGAAGAGGVSGAAGRRPGAAPRPMSTTLLAACRREVRARVGVPRPAEPRARRPSGFSFGRVLSRRGAARLRPRRLLERRRRGISARCAVRRAAFGRLQSQRAWAPCLRRPRR